MRVVVIGVEDLLVDRLRAAVHWQSEEDRRWARRLGLLYADRVDWAYVRARTAGDPAESAEADRLAREAAG